MGRKRKAEAVASLRELREVLHDRDKVIATALSAACEQMSAAVARAAQTQATALERAAQTLAASWERAAQLEGDSREQAVWVASDASHRAAVVEATSRDHITQVHGNVMRELASTQLRR